jgi:hypothetical protein
VAYIIEHEHWFDYGACLQGVFGAMSIILCVLLEIFVLSREGALRAFVGRSGLAVCR